MVFGPNFWKKNNKFGYLNPILGKLKVTHDLGWWLAGKPMVDFPFTVIELFLLSVTVPELWGKMCTTQLFSQEVNLFALKFYMDRVVPNQPFLASENKRHWATRWWKPHPSAFPCFDTTLECDGQTDRRICRSIYLSLIHIWRCRRIERCRSRWSPYH